MKFIVCVKSVPGIISSVGISETGDAVKPTARSYYMNETDEYALDEALVLRGKTGGDVTAITIGPISFEEILHSAVAKGADKGVRVEASSDDPAVTSRLLAEAIRSMSFDIVLTGIESSDDMAAQVNITIAERLGIPFVFGATAIEINTETITARVTRESGGGAREVLEVNLPALIATQSGIQPLTYPPVAKLFQARRRGIDCITLSSLGLDKEALTGKGGQRFLEVSKPKKRHVVEPMSGTPQEIAEKLTDKIMEVL